MVETVNGSEITNHEFKGSNEGNQIKSDFDDISEIEVKKYVGKVISMH